MAAFLVIAIGLRWLALILSIALLVGALLGNIREELAWTGQSLLIMALLHASFNASEQSKLAVFDGAWQQIAAATVLLVVGAPLRTFQPAAGHHAAAAR